MKLLQAAARDHAAGRLAEAERGYRGLLELEPGHADGLHLLGALLGQCGKVDEGVEFVSRAIAVRPGAGAYHASLAKLLKSREEIVEAIAAYREAVRLEPTMADAHNNLGVALRDRKVGRGERGVWGGDSSEAWFGGGLE